jgi:two-component system KDP operon response regulator KdpE
MPLSSSVGRISITHPAAVLILSARSQEQNKIMALDAGADDYLTKPFGSGELHARLQAL